ncbi:hypothetical protein COU49_02245 [Candidatus Nomurabacteria bacterium CG10_big_fil_rev_8_21_14_0_10_35_16]|uniref:Uncharacterized protein n=1 Tax=Candidatus Nomurabacteria bacterium CG10_big_fil_rev_8_21_14_0_10_35_16 TaxID=1974731 RepID=A0A2H0TAX0_9BACT|nr:MAG: hypothetical protein COU49_02245 [Candidatus Nomurabacteria bacterium CG10_big_fil_rev_8_21_14_0_10_35_16]
MQFSEETKKYWEDKDWNDLEKAKSVADLYIIAKRIISRIPKPFVQVCGPIGTGGLGSIEANLKLFNKAIKKLQNQGINVFDQMPFEKPMQKLHDKSVAKGKYPENILTDFYCPLFESGLISTFYFLFKTPGFSSFSMGVEGANLILEPRVKILSNS